MMSCRWDQRFPTLMRTLLSHCGLPNIRYFLCGEKWRYQIFTFAFRFHHFDTRCSVLQGEEIKHQDVDSLIVQFTLCYNRFQSLYSTCIAGVVTAGQQECAQSLKTLWLVFTVGPFFFFGSRLQIDLGCKVWVHAFKSALCNWDYVENQPGESGWRQHELRPRYILSQIVVMWPSTAIVPKVWCKNIK